MLRNQVEVGCEPTKEFPTLQGVEPGQMFRKPNGSEIYMAVGYIASAGKTLYIQLSNGHRQWTGFPGEVNISPLARGTRVQITQG